MLLLVGTYSEALGHVNGKGSGVYVFDVGGIGLGPPPPSPPLAAPPSLFGRAQLGGPAGLRNPTYLTSWRCPTTGEVHVYAVDERVDGPGTVSAHRLHRDTGRLEPLGPSGGVPAAAPGIGGGAACCHVAVTPDGRWVLAANYLGGSVTAVRRNGDGSLDPGDAHYYRLGGEEDWGGGGGGEVHRYPGPNASRQEGPHAHMVVFSKGTRGSTVLVPDLGSDVVWSLPYLGGEEGPGGGGGWGGAGPGGPLGPPVPSVGAPALRGGGPRHLALSPCGRRCYVTYELTSLVASYDLSEETGALEGSAVGIASVLDGVRSRSLGLGLGGGEGGGDGDGDSDGDGDGDDDDDGRGGQDRPYESLLTGGGREGPRSCSDARTSTAAIRATADGSSVLVSSRLVGAEGAVSALPLRGGHLVCGGGGGASIRGTVGRTPRDFVLLEASSAVLVANQDTDEIVLLRDGEDPRVLTKGAPTPVCLCIVPN